MLPYGSNLPPISLADIQASFGLGTNLNAYRGTLFYRPDNSTGYFSTGIINLSDFYATNGTSPVVPGSVTYTSGSSIILPVLFNKLYVTCYGGGGGGGQGSNGVGWQSTYAGNIGSNGGNTYFMPGTGYAVSGAGGGAGGGGATTYTNYLGGLITDGTGSAGAAGSGGGGGAAGSAGGKTGGVYSNGLPSIYTQYSQGANGGAGGQGGNSGEILVMDINSMGWAAIKNYYNATVGVSIGAGGAGGGGAYGAGYAGGAGGGGWIVIRWT